MFLDIDWISNIEASDWVIVTVDKFIGCRRHTDNCPWFHALRPYGATRVNVTHTLFIINGFTVSRSNPLAMRTWIKAFDSSLKSDNISILINTKTLEMKEI